jgi:hypothetical protein
MSNEPASPLSTPDYRVAPSGTAPRVLARLRAAALSTALLLPVLAVIATGSWLLLHRWYGLFENRDNTHFSFEKIPGGFDSDIMRDTAAIFLILSVVYGTALWILRDRPTSPRLACIGGIALVVGPAIVNVLLYPVGALDVFNYLVELKLAHHYGENPYLVTFARFAETDPFALPAFLTDVKLFYGPAWLLAMRLPTAVSGFTDVIDALVALKLFNVALIALTAGLVAWHQRDQRLRWLAVAMFAANPLVLFEGVANAHNDVLLTVFVVGAMLALERRSPLAGPLLALSALVKLYTVALAPIFIAVALRERWGWRRIAATVALTALAVTLTAAPWWGDGELVGGLRAGLEESQEMDHVSPLSLVRQYAQEQIAADSLEPELVRSRPSFEIVPERTQDHVQAAFTATFVVTALLIALAVWRGRPPALAAAETLLLLFLFMTNLYPWYLIPVVALLALRPDRLGTGYVVGATALGLVYYPMFIFGHFNSGWTRFHIHLFLALFLTVPIVVYLVARLRTWRADMTAG